MKNLKSLTAIILANLILTGYVFADNNVNSVTSNINYEVTSNNTTLSMKCLVSGLFFNVFNSEQITVELWSYNSSAPVFSGQISQLNPAIGQLESIDLGNISGNYYIVFKYENALPTWSRLPVNFFSGMNVNYDFTSAASQAYNSNQILLNASPLLYGGCSGDVNQDGIIDATDLMYISNDVENYLPLSGYPTDLNANGIIAGNDLILADENAIEFRIVEKPW